MQIIGTSNDDLGGHIITLTENEYSALMNFIRGVIDAADMRNVAVAGCERLAFDTMSRLGDEMKVARSNGQIPGFVIKRTIEIPRA